MDAILNVDGTPVVRPVRGTPWYLLPIVLPLRALAVLLEFVGRVLAAVLGLTMLLIGGLLSLTWIGAPVGIPICVLGLFLVLRSLF